MKLSFLVNAEQHLVVDAIHRNCRHIGCELERPGGIRWTLNEAPRRGGPSPPWTNEPRIVPVDVKVLELTWDGYGFKDEGDMSVLWHQLDVSMAVEELSADRCQVTIEYPKLFQESADELVQCIQQLYPEVREQLQPGGEQPETSNQVADQDAGQAKPKNHGGYSHPPEKRKEIADAARLERKHRDASVMNIWTNQKYNISWKTVQRYMKEFPES